MKRRSKLVFEDQSDVISYNGEDIREILLMKSDFILLDVIASSLLISTLKVKHHS